MNRGNLLGGRNGRFLTFGPLYVSEDVPYSYTSIAMVAFTGQQRSALGATLCVELCIRSGHAWAAPNFKQMRGPGCDVKYVKSIRERFL
jgi:hypothetical protein